MSSTSGTSCAPKRPSVSNSAGGSHLAALTSPVAAAHISLSIYLATLCLPYLVWAAKICENFDTQRRLRRIAEHQNSPCTLFIGRSRSEPGKLADPLTPRERERPDQMPPRPLPRSRLQNPSWLLVGQALFTWPLSNRLSWLPESESRNGSAWKSDEPLVPASPSYCGPNWPRLAARAARTKSRLVRPVLVESESDSTSC